MVLSLALAFYTGFREKLFLELNQITSPHVSLGPVIIYFFGAVALMGLILFIIPVNKFRLVLRILFAFTYGWGVFIVAALTLPLSVAYILAAVAGLVWLFWARVWLHDLLLLITLSGAGAVFGFLFSPLTFMFFMLVIAIYDIVAVRYGYMVWMAEKLSESDSLPAFILPKKIRDWTLSLKSVRVGDLTHKESGEREYVVLGGGDIGFPLMLAVSVFFQTGLVSAIIVGVFSLFGLMGVFLIQLLWLKGRAIPALPPIAFGSVIGLIITMLFVKPF